MSYKNICIVLLGLSTPVAFSGTMGSTTSKTMSPFYLLAGSGASFANDAKLSFNPNYWSGTPSGYNSSLGTAPLYTAGIGYLWSDFLNIDVSYAYRGLYQYSKYQTPSATSATDPNPLSASRTRYFDLSSNSLLFNATLLGKGYSDKLAYDMDNMGFIQPFLGAGIGISYNTMGNFHTILSGTNYSTSVMSDYTQPALAYQLNAGLEWKYERIAIDVGYRYFYAGGYSSSNYLTTNLNTSGTPVATTEISPWTGTLSANEVFVTAKIQF